MACPQLKKQCVSPKPRTSSQHAGNQPQELALWTLPKGPLLRVLSHLKPNDLGAAGRAYPRLAELTRAHRSLWLGAHYFYELQIHLIDDLVELLQRALPTVDKLYFDNRCGCCTYEDNGNDWAEHNSRRLDSGFLEVDANVTALSVSGPGDGCTAIIDLLAPRLKYLQFAKSELGMDDLSILLRKACCLETLSFEVQLLCREWPQDLVLPSLRAVEFHIRDSQEDDPTFDAIGSLFGAHSGQLRSVTLRTVGLEPVVDVDTWPSDLDQLSIVGTPRAVDEYLQGMQRLKQLRVTLKYGRKYGVVQQWDKFLDYSFQRRLGLKRLELVRCRIATAADLLAGGLGGLEALVVLLTSSPTAELFQSVNPATIPALNMLVVSSSCTARSELSSHTCSCRRSEENNARMVTVLQRVVRDAPVASLHVCVRLCQVFTARSKFVLLFRHSPTELECSLCAEATTAIRELRLEPSTTQVERAQVM